MGVKETENGMGAVFHRIKELHMEKRRPFLILLIVETFLLIAGIAALFGKDAVYEYGREAMTCNFGTFSEEYQGVVAGYDGKYGGVYGNHSAQGHLPHTAELCDGYGLEQSGACDG